jgi:hypothetical protein
MTDSFYSRKAAAVTILCAAAATLAGVAEPLRDKPRHRYSFDGTGKDGARIADSVGTRHGTLAVQKGDSRLSGKGDLILNAGAWDAEVRFAPEVVTEYENFSLEFWFTPETSKYEWHIIFRLDNNQGKNGDYFWYTLRNYQTHRVEIADDGLNEHLQAKVEGFQRGKPVHLVVTYEATGGDGETPLVRWFAQGKLIAEKTLKTRLTDLDLTRLLLGPTHGRFDEFRVYDYPLTASEIRGNLRAGPDEIPLAK